MVKNNCCFCKEIKEGRIQKDFSANTKFERRILLENEKFLALVSVSPIVDGHVLILPKDHLKGLIQVNDSSFTEFKQFFYETKRMLDAKYDSTMFFEHGVGSNVTNGGCGIDHAHMHLLPISYLNMNKIINEVNKEFDLSLSSLEEMRKKVPNHDSYIMMGSDIESTSFHISKSIKSQYLRNKIEYILGKPKSDWKDLSNWKEFDNTLETLMA